MKISRKELYDLVWSETMTSISRRFGISIDGLRKHCKSMNIPTPPNGYWSKLKYGKNPIIIPLPEEYIDNRQSTDLGEKDQSEKKVITLSAPLSRYKIRELEISEENIACFEVPEVLYAKDPIIIDTKEKFRRDSENTYLKKSPYKSKIGPTLDVYTSEKSLDRALSIFSTVIKALRLRGHSIKIANDRTYAVITAEEIRYFFTDFVSILFGINSRLFTTNSE